MKITALYSGSNYQFGPGQIGVLWEQGSPVAGDRAILLRGSTPVASIAIPTNGAIQTLFPGLYPNGNYQIVYMSSGAQAAASDVFAVSGSAATSDPVIEASVGGGDPIPANTPPPVSLPMQTGQPASGISPLLIWGGIGLALWYFLSD